MRILALLKMREIRVITVTRDIRIIRDVRVMVDRQTRDFRVSRV